MPLAAADSVRVLWTGTGTGTMSLGAAIAGFQAFPSALSGLPVSYAVENEDGSERENGIGTFTAPTTLTRDRITFSTAGAPTKQSFSAGNKHVRLVGLAHDIAENRATTDPTATDDITDGYIEGRARWLNTATDTLFICVDHRANTAVWAVVTSQAQVEKLAGIAAGAGMAKPDVPFSASETVLAAHNGQRRMFSGTSLARVTVPDGLPEGTTVEYVTASDTANLGPLIIERVSADGARRKGDAMGCRVLGSGGRVLVRKEQETAPRIWGDLVPASMHAQNGGASFLLERGLRQTKSGGILAGWGDRHGLHDFLQSDSEATVGDGGEAVFDCVDGADVTILSSSLATFSGSGVLFGICCNVVSITMTTSDKTWLNLGGYSEGVGWYFSTGNPAGAGTTPSSWAMNIMLDTSSLTTLFSQPYRLGQPVAIGVAIMPSASNGYAYGFSDEGHSGREIGYVKTGLVFTKAGGWQSQAFTPSFGPILAAGDNMKVELYALTIRDGLTFASQDEARDQAHAMLAEMRGYA